MLLSVLACLLDVYCSYQVIIFQRAEEKLGGKKKIDEERNQRASIFLPINPLKVAKINTTRLGCTETLWGYDTSEVYRVRFFCDAL